jgi:exonuclease VII small subunit
MARKTISLDQKLEKAETAVIIAKARYDKALDELEKLVTKRKQLDDKRVLDAYHSSHKSIEEIIDFLQTADKKQK